MEVMRKLFAILLFCAGTARAAEVTLSIDAVTWPAGQGQKLFFHVVHHPPFPPYPHDYMIGYNFAVHVPPGLVFTDGDGTIFAPWIPFINCGTCPPGGNISIVGILVGDPTFMAANQSSSGALFFRNVTGQTLTPCSAPLAFVDFQAGAGLGDFTSEVAPFPCAGPPSDVAPRPSVTWGAVKQLFQAP